MSDINRLYLDDVRVPKDDTWLIFRSVSAIKAYILDYDSNLPLVMSLDHDLGDGVPTGYDFIAWYEEMIYTGVKLPRVKLINIHSANPVGLRRMNMAVDSIMRYYQEEGL